MIVFGLRKTKGIYKFLFFKFHSMKNIFSL